MTWLTKLFCRIGLHDWRPTSTLTCNSNDTGKVCRKCFKEMD